MAWMAGFGPAREGVKVPCLTAWLHPCISSHRLPAALCLPTSHQELGNYTSRLILSFLRFLARWPGWYGIAVLPCFSASGEVPVTRCGLPLRGTYAAYWPSFSLRLSHATGNYAPKSRSPYSVWSNRSRRIKTSAVFSELCHFHVSHDDNGLTLSGRYPASGRDGWESNPPKRFWRPPRQPWNIRPYVCLSFQTVTAACRLPAVGPHRYTFLLPCCAHLRATRL